MNDFSSPSFSFEHNFLFKKNIVFTGTLQSMDREKAQHLVHGLNGNIQTSVTKKTDILVQGMNLVNLFDQEHFSKKEKLAKKYQLEGIPLVIMSEKEFFEIVVQQFKQLQNHLI